MTEHMTVKEALELAIAALDACKYGGGQQAAEVLRNGSARVEKVSTHKLAVCPSCNKILQDGTRCPSSVGTCPKYSFFGCMHEREFSIFDRTYTEHEEIRIVPVKSKPVFEKVEETT